MPLLLGPRSSLVAPLLFALLSAPSIMAQSQSGVPADPSSAYDQEATVPDAPTVASHYVAPDVPDRWAGWTVHEGKYFSIKLGVVAIFDYDSFGQDSNSLAQVGQQHDQWDARAVRIALAGKLGYHFPIKYFLFTEYKGLDRPDDARGWGSTDVSLSFPLVRERYGSITVGKTKETFSYEMVGDSANLPQLERLLNPFFTTRNVGVKYFNSFANKRLMVSGGWFNDWWTRGVPYEASSNHFTTRFAFLPAMSRSGDSFLHLAFATRWIGATNGTLQLAARPESSVTTPYADTGKFAARSSANYGFEGLANSGPVSFLAEYIYATTDAPTVGNPNFYGTYLTGSWVITGEHRPYDPTVAYARRIIPRRRFGAVEIVGRIGRVDLTNKQIQGGALNSYSGNISWWPDRRYRLVVGYGRYDLNRFGILGTTTQFHTRFQWIF